MRNRLVPLSSILSEWCDRHCADMPQPLHLTITGDSIDPMVLVSPERGGTMESCAIACFVIVGGELEPLEREELGYFSQECDTAGVE